MPALITHDMFGRDVYGLDKQRIGSTQDELDAFLLGNQGPDPFFYGSMLPGVDKSRTLGSVMHRRRPAALVKSLKDALDVLDKDDYRIGRAFALGFICHYELDCHVHPLVYAQQYAFCDAGIEGLTRDDGNDVHAIIESDLDEMVLYVKRGETVASYQPWTEIFKGSDHVLDVISKMSVYQAITVYGSAIPANFYARSVKNFRRLRHLLYSPFSGKRLVIGGLEQLLRPHSIYSSMSHRAIGHETSPYDNREHATWVNPFTDEESDASFWDLYTAALDGADELIDAFLAPGFSVAVAHELTGDLDFSGRPTEALILSIEDREGTDA